MNNPAGFPNSTAQQPRQTQQKGQGPWYKKTWIDSVPIDMLLSAVSVLVVAQSISKIPEGLMNNPVYCKLFEITGRGVLDWMNVA
jgi:hypothetical protein